MLSNILKQSQILTIKKKEKKNINHNENSIDKTLSIMYAAIWVLCITATVHLNRNIQSVSRCNLISLSLNFMLKISEYIDVN